MVENDLCALDVRHERVHWLFDDEAHTDCGRQVVDDVAAVHELVHHGRLQDRVDDEVEIAPLAQVRDVTLGPSGEIVEDEYLGSPVEQQLGEVRSDETGPTCDECAAQGTAMVATPAAIMGA